MRSTPYILHSKKLLFFLLFLFSVLVSVSLASTRVDAYNPLTDAEARTILTNRCPFLPASTQTIHIIYIEASTFDQNNSTVTLYLKGMSHRCSNGSISGVGQRLNSTTVEIGGSTNNIAVPDTFYSGKSILQGGFTTPVRRGPYTLSGVSAGANQIRYDYTAFSAGSSGDGWDYISFTAGDVCSNLPGLQWPNPPPGYTRSGSFCALPESWNYNHIDFDIDQATPVEPGQAVGVSGKVTNVGAGRGASYTYVLQRRIGAGAWTDIGSRFTNSSALNSSETSGLYSRSYSIPTTSNNNASICFRAAFNPSSGQSSPSLTSTGGWEYAPQQCVTVQKLSPVCGSSGTNGITFSPNTPIAAGTVFTTSADIDNPNSYAINITSVNYAVTRTDGTVPAGTNLSGSRPVTDIPANTTDDTAEYSRSNIRINEVGTFDVTWTIGHANGGPVVCERTITTQLSKAVCNLAGATVSRGQEFRFNVTVRNPNTVGDIDVTLPVSYVTNLPGATSPGEGRRVNDASNLSNPLGSSDTMRLESTGIITPTTAGVFTITWTIEVSPATASPAEKSDGSACTTTITVSDSPYTRFYGNDVIACRTGLGGGQVKIHSKGNAAADHRGGASQLAIFAAQSVSGVMSGSQGSRSTVKDLTFSNSVASGPFGGSFAGPGSTCSDINLEIANILSKGVTATRSAGAIGNFGAGIVTNGVYRYTSGTLRINATSVPIGKKFIIVADGDVIINNPISYDGSLVGWGSIDEIPSLKIYASGNIFIRYAATSLDGHYVSANSIYTCSRNSTSITSLTSSNSKNLLASQCRDNRLTVDGSLRANRIHFLRTRGTLYNSPGALEPASSPNLAEVFVFSPEAYVSAVAGFRVGKDTVKLDSIVSRPPSY